MKPEDNPFNSMKGHPRFYELLVELAELHHKKNQDYATEADPFANFRACEAAGVSIEDGIYTRMSDKWSRITNLIRKRRDGISAAVADETIKDTLQDLAVYATILQVVLEEKSGIPWLADLLAKDNEIALNLGRRRIDNPAHYDHWSWDE